MARRALAGMRVVVTGASSGIGRSLALELGRRKARLLLVARRAEVLQQVCDEVASLKGVALPAVGDVTDPTCRADIARAGRDHFGGLDILVNNAGTSAHGDFATESPDVTRQIFEVNFFSAVDLTRGLLPLLLKGDHPMVVNIGSILGQRGIPFNATYCASKFALTGWSESLRAELAPLGIDLLLVSPGSTDTPFRDHLVEKRMSLSWERRKGVSPDHVARLTCNAIERGAHRLTTDWPGWGLLALHRLAPGLVDGVMARLAARQTK